MPEAFTITELTGSERSIELRDRAMPYKPVSWPGEQRTEKTLYPGNPQATIQVLGPEEIDVEIRGRWKDRYIGRGNMIVLSGWDSIVSAGETPSAEQMVQVFHTLRRSGNLLEVRWGPEIRRGVLKRFEPNYHRLDVIEWTCRFEWLQYGATAPTPFTSAPSQTMSAELAATLAALNDIASGMPQILFPDFVAEALTLQGTIAAASLTMIEADADITGIPVVTQDQFQGFSSKVADVVDACSALRQAVDVPVTEMVPTDDMVNRLAGYVWARDMSAALVALAVAAVRARETIRDRTVSAYLAEVTLKTNQTLRDLARQYYGSADDWTYIADANGLVGSSHAAGTKIMVPRRQTGSGRAA